MSTSDERDCSVAGGRPAIERRVFVVGVPRSGTTLVQSLLAAHPAVTSFTESHFFSRHFAWLPWASAAIVTRDPEPRLREFLVENGLEPRDLGLEADRERSALARIALPLRARSLARGFLDLLDELARRRRVRSWVEKTPAHLRFVRFLESVSAAEKPTSFVHVIRDGVDVVASLHRASQGWERPYDLETCARRWNDEVALSLDRIRSPRDHFVFYEELTCRPEQTLERLLCGLGLPWDPDLLQGHAAETERLVTDEETWKSDAGPAIRPSSEPGRTLSDSQREQVRGWLRPDLYTRLADEAARRAGEARGR